MDRVGTCDNVAMESLLAGMRAVERAVSILQNRPSDAMAAEREVT